MKFVVLQLNKRFEIAFCLESADSNCTAVSKGGKIQNTKLKIEHSTFFEQWNLIIPIFLPRISYSSGNFASQTP